jgi:hypothetical protein
VILIYDIVLSCTRSYGFTVYTFAIHRQQQASRLASGHTPTKPTATHRSNTQLYRVDSRSSVAKSCTRRKSAAGEIFEISLSHKTYFLYKIIDILRFCETLCMPSKYQNSCYDHTCIAMIHNSSSTCLRLQCQSDQHTVQNEYKADTQPHADRQHPSAFVRECTDHAKTTNSRFALVKRSPNSVELTQQCTLLRRWQRQ